MTHYVILTMLYTREGEVSSASWQGEMTIPAGTSRREILDKAKQLLIDASNRSRLPAHVIHLGVPVFFSIEPLMVGA